MDSDSARGINRRRLLGWGGGNPGVGANWDIYPDTGWVGVILANCDEVPLQEMGEQELQAVTGQPVSGGGGGGGG
jgi:hypothetical protein